MRTQVFNALAFFQHLWVFAETFHQKTQGLLFLHLFCVDSGGKGVIGKQTFVRVDDYCQFLAVIPFTKA